MRSLRQAASRIPKKHLGQHFLTATYYAQRIAEAVPAGPDENVVEIGPGTGALTQHLIKRFPRLHCVEKDGDLLEELRARLGPGDYTIHHADAREFDFSRVGFPLHVVGNLPYGVASIILRQVLFLGTAMKSCTVMVQREVAERMTAKPHSKRHGFLTVLCGFFGEARVLFHVPPGAFYPRPAVESSVVQIMVYRDLEMRLPREAWESFFAFVDQSSRMRRKKVLNAMQRIRPDIDYQSIFNKLAIDPLARAEDLGMKEWLGLYRETVPC